MWEHHTRLAPLIKIANNLGVFASMRKLNLSRNSRTILLHGTYGKKYDHIPKDLHFGMHIEELEKMLIWLRNHHIPVISYQEYLKGSPGLLITMDDGYANNYDFALPLFEKYNTPATIFVTTRHIINDNKCNALDYFKEKMLFHNVDVPFNVGYDLFYGLTPEQLNKLSHHPLITIGGHTHNHPHLDQCSSMEIRNEIEINLSTIEEITGKKPIYFAYPFGDYNQEVIDVLKKNGIVHAMAVIPKLNNNVGFEDKRIGIYYADDHYLSAKLNFVTSL